MEKGQTQEKGNDGLPVEIERRVMHDPFDFLNDVREEDRALFGEAWCGPDRMERDWVLIAKYESAPDDDGQTVEIYCSAMPARLYKIKALDTPNSVGEEQEGFEMTTGSGMAKMAAELGKAISEGMIGMASA